MQKLGASNRRKSYGEVHPILPRKSLTREDTRTLHQQLPSMNEELKAFKRRLLFDNLPSHAKKNNKSAHDTRASQHDYNYVSETSSRKNNPTLMTMGSESEQRLNDLFKISLAQFSITHQLEQNTNQIESHDQQVEPRQTIKLNIDDDNPPTIQNENMDDYTMGNKIEADEPEEDDNNYVPKLKSFARSDNQNIVSQQLTDAEARMEMRYLTGKFQLVKARRQDNQLLRMISQYKQNKHSILKQSNRKLQSMKALANMRKAISLPKLANPNYNIDKVQQIVVPSFEQIANPDGNPEQQRRRLTERRLEGSMSLGRLGMKKDKNINYEKYLEQEMEYIAQTERKLREKGVKINAGTLKNSLINIRDPPPPQLSDSGNLFPTPQLVSNPYYPKQAAKPKKKKR